MLFLDADVRLEKGAIALLFVVPWLGLAIGLGMSFLGASAAKTTLLLGTLAVVLQLYMRLSASDVIEQPWRYLWLGWLGGGIVSVIAITSLVKTETGWG